MKVILGFWDPAADISKIRERIGAQCFDEFVTTPRTGSSDAQSDRMPMLKGRS